jgi:hypothetical protein
VATMRALLLPVVGLSIAMSCSSEPSEKNTATGGSASGAAGASGKGGGLSGGGGGAGTSVGGASGECEGSAPALGADGCPLEVSVSAGKPCDDDGKVCTTMEPKDEFCATASPDDDDWLGAYYECVGGCWKYSHAENCFNCCFGEGGSGGIAGGGAAGAGGAP